MLTAARTARRLRPIRRRGQRAEAAAATRDDDFTGEDIALAEVMMISGDDDGQAAGRPSGFDDPGHRRTPRRSRATRDPIRANPRRRRSFADRS